MGANISMDVSAGIVSDTQLSFEDKLRQEVVLIPEGRCPRESYAIWQGEALEKELKEKRSRRSREYDPLPNRAHDRATPRTGAANHR